MTLEEIAAELYALPLDEFTAHRDACARKLRSDRALAAQVKALRKPTATAALVNALVRADPDRISALLGLGDQMRTATETRDPTLLSLGEQRRVLIAELLTRARDLGETPPTPAVEQVVTMTLEAATASREVGRAVASGRLVKPVRYAGFGEVSLPDVVALPDRLPELPAPTIVASTAAPSAAAPSAAAPSAAAPSAAGIATAQRATREAADAADDAQRSYEQRVREVEQAAAAVDAAQAEVARLHNALADAERALAAARARRSTTQRAARDAEPHGSRGAPEGRGCPRPTSRRRCGLEADRLLAPESYLSPDSTATSSAALSQRSSRSPTWTRVPRSGSIVGTR